MDNISEYSDLSLSSTSYIDVGDIKSSQPENKNIFDDIDYSIDFTQKNWNKFIKKMETGQIVEEKKVEVVQNIDLSTSVPTLGPQVEFIESGTSLNVTGRKVISINYSGKKYINQQTTNIREQSTSNFDITQQLQVRMQGKIGDRITVNVDYDDTKSDKQDISLIYQGEPQDVVQNISFGDIDLSLPATEFVSYNKQLFGIRADLKSGGLKTTVIGSRTKGQTKTRQFRGNTQFKTVDIPDSSYIRRKYYSIIFSSYTSFLPIKPGSEKIYIDQQTPEPVDGILISSITADDLVSSAITYTGKFRLLTRGIDYTIDYNRGEVMFSRNLNPQDVIIIDYQKFNGTWLRDENGSGRMKILKTYNDIYISNPTEMGWNNEIKTYYSIGQTNIVRDNGFGNFILKIQNLNRQEIGHILNPIQKYPDTIEVDFEQGIIKLKSPFTSDTNPSLPDPQTYSPSPITKRIIHVEYYYRINTFFLEPNIVFNSEIIKIDGKKLIKNQDYYIDYDSGFLTFYNSEDIRPDSLIDIYYEVSPFGSSDQTLVGGRISYDFSRYVSAGTTLLYQSSSKTSKAPQITDLSSNMLVYDGDINIKDINLLGLRSSVGFEVAGSVLNPNVNGNAIIDNMESSKQEDAVSFDKNYWQIASNPSNEISHANSVYWDTIEVNKKDVNPSSPENSKQQVLNIDYDFSISSEVSIVYVFSKTGIDFSKKNSIELTLKGDNNFNGPIVNIHFGEINEDSDGTGGMTLVCSNGKVVYNAPKTEDINCDGVLSPGEDKGWLYSPSGLGSRKFGENNGRIDTQDLDGNGRLDAGNAGIGGHFGYYGNNYFIDISSNNTLTREVNFDSWHNWIFPLIISSSESYKWSNIKVVRFTLRKGTNTPIKGKISLAKLSAVGNSWNVQFSTYATEVINVYTVNNLDNPNYVPLFNAGGIITSLYNELYGSVKEQKSSTGDSNIVEQALSISFNNWTSTSTSYVYRKFLTPFDISQHKELRFFVYGVTPNNNANLYIKFGDQHNYFKVSIPVDFTGWKVITIRQIDSNNDGVADNWVSFDPSIIISTSGNFSLQQIFQIMVGLDIKDSSSHNVTVYLNDLYLSEPIKKKGTARKVQGNFDIPGFASFGGKHRFIDRMFQTPISAITNQDLEESFGYLTLSKPSFLSTSYTFSKKITNTPNVYNTGNNNLVNLLQQGKVKTEEVTAKGIFNPGIIPKVDLSYSKTRVNYLLIGRNDDKTNYLASTNFSPSMNFFLIPKNVNLFYSYAKNDISYMFLSILPQDYYNSTERVDSYSGKMSFNIFNFLDFSPNYSYSRTYEKRSYYLKTPFSYPKNIQQLAGFSSSIGIFKWFRPSINYNININENSNISVTTVTVGQSSKFFGIGDIKTINRNANGNITFNISMYDIVPNVKGLRSMVITSNYQLQDGDVWNNVERSFDSKKYFWIRNKLNPKSSLSLRQSATIRDSYSSGIRIQPFEGLNLSGRLKPFNTSSIISNFTYSKQDSYSYNVLTRTRNRVLPDLIFSISQVEDIFLFSKWMRSSLINIKYSNNISEVSGSSRDKTRNFGFDFRFYFMNFMNTSITYNLQTGEKKDLRINQITSYTKRKSFSLQGSFDKNSYRFTPRIDYSNDFARSTLGSVITNTTIINPSLLVRTDIRVPKKFKLPFLQETMFDNRIIWTTTLNYIFKKSSVAIVDNNRLFTMSSSAEIEASKNLRLSLNASLQRFWHKYLTQEDYISYQLGTNIILQF
ncbi:MAG: hypothetical protein N2Z20_03235 [Elusimicrobiales bacterium]|nr:hypothetical protein [Elusimicrobiales bacterium]